MATWGFGLSEMDTDDIGGWRGAGMEYNSNDCKWVVKKPVCAVFS